MTYPAIHDVLGQLVSGESVHDMMDLSMATTVSVRLSIAEDGVLVWLFLVGPPSSGKTEVILALRSCPFVVPLDKPTPEMFASGAYDSDTKSKAKAFLPLLDGRTLAIKDLTSILSMRAERVRGFIGDLTNIFDGEFTKGTGMAFGGATVTSTHTSKFSFLAALTSMAYMKHSRYMAEVGTRALVYHVPSLTAAETKAGFALSDNPQAGALRQTLRGLVRDHLVATMATSAPPLPARLDAYLRDYSRMVALGRRPIIWTPYGTEEGWKREPILAQPEGPFRSYRQLRTLLRALAWVRGEAPNAQHLKLVHRVAMGSMIGDRSQVLQAMHDQGPLTVDQCAVALDRTGSATRALLDEMRRVGLLTGISAPTGAVGKPPVLYRPVDEFAPIVLKPEYLQKTTLPTQAAQP